MSDRSKQRPMTRLVVRVSVEEPQWVKHAAQLANRSLADYVKHAINDRLQQQGVDAVLIRTHD